MTLDDDSLLSAYMDGQLSPDQQQLVESVLVSHPPGPGAFRDSAGLPGLPAGVARRALGGRARPGPDRLRSRLRLRAVLTASLHSTLASPRWARAGRVLGIA